MKLSEAEIQKFQEKIINWHEKYGRDFPWRNTHDPYKILVSEFLLQKTHVRKVEDVYQSFLKHYPTIEKLSKAKTNDVINIINPLGFLNRADRMISLAEKVVNDFDGNIPKKFDILLGFHGVGRYIATAVTIFAFKEKRVLVDTNVIKVLEYEFGYISTKKRPRTDKKLWSFAQSLAPKKQIKEFNWGLLDFGAKLKSKQSKILKTFISQKI